MADNIDVVSSTMEQNETGAATAGQHGNGDSTSAPLTPGKANLLVILGEPFTVEHQQLILQRLSSELQSWDVAASNCDIGQELQNLAAKSTQVTPGASDGEKVIEYSSDAVNVTILINPILKTVVQRIRTFLLNPGSYRQLIYSGRAIQKSGCWILQDALFSSHMFADVLRAADVAQAQKSGAVSGVFNLSVFPEGEWASTSKLTNPLKTVVSSSSQENTSSSTALAPFISFLQPIITVTLTQDLLPATNVVGNIRFNRPTLYVFPGADGDSALFGISGFNLLVNGGYYRKACFWDFVRHLDRIDAMLVTHLGSDNIFGLGAALGRKALDKSLHPDIGYVYMNASSAKSGPDHTPSSETGSSEVSADKSSNTLLVNLSVEATNIVEDVRNIGLTPHPLSAPSHGTLTPTNLYHKIGHGTLDLYPLNPVHDSKTLKDFMTQWSKHINGFTAKSGAIPLSHSTSICSVLVWKPASSNDAITRILFTGSAPQSAVFEGLDRIKAVALFQRASCSEKVLSGPSKPASAAARKSVSKPAAPPAQPAQPKATPAVPRPANLNTSKVAAPSGAANKTSAPPKTEAKKTAATKEAAPKADASPTKPQAQKNAKQPALASASKKAATPVVAKKQEAEQAAAAVAPESVQLVDTTENLPTTDSTAAASHVAAAAAAEEISSTEPHTDLLSPASEQHEEPVVEEAVTDKAAGLVEGVDADKDIDTTNHLDGASPEQLPIDSLEASPFEGSVPEGLPPPEVGAEELYDRSESPIDKEQEGVVGEEHVPDLVDEAAVAELETSRHEDFDPQSQWGQPEGLPAPNKPPGKGEEGQGDAKKGAAAATAKPPSKAPNGKDPAGKLNESVNKPPSALGKKTSATASRPQSSADQSSIAADPKQATKSASARPAPASAAAKKPAAAPVKSAAPLKPVVPFYVDLAYIPAHGSSDYLDIDFFRRVRARYYVLSTVNPDPKLLTALLEAKGTWEAGEVSSEVTLIPTYDADVLRYWMGAHRDEMSRLRIDVAPASNRCSIQLQDHEAGCAAYRLEF